MRTLTRAGGTAGHQSAAAKQVTRAAADTGAAAQSTNQATDELARMAAEMQQLVGRFTLGVRLAQGFHLGPPATLAG